MYKLEVATNNDKELLIKYKLATILDYCRDIDNEEKEKINNYVQKTITQQINNYQVIKINNKINGILLNEIFLESAYRKKEIGTEILTNILETNPKVYLWVYKENEVALNLYKKLGFKIKEITETRFFMEYSK